MDLENYTYAQQMVFLQNVLKWYILSIQVSEIAKITEGVFTPNKFISYVT